MTRTERLKGYKKGKPVKGREDGANYRWYQHEKKDTRKEIERSYRRECRNAVAHGRDPPRRSKTCGWETW